MNKLIACTTDMTTCDANLQKGLFENFFALMVSYMHGNTISTPFMAMDSSPEANNVGYPTGEDGTIGMNLYLYNRNNYK